jgi:hypothetical protein
MLSCDLKTYITNAKRDKVWLLTYYVASLLIKKILCRRFLLPITNYLRIINYGDLFQLIDMIFKIASHFFFFLIIVNGVDGK